MQNQNRMESLPYASLILFTIINFAAIILCLFFDSYFFSLVGSYVFAISTLFYGMFKSYFILGFVVLLISWFVYKKKHQKVLVLLLINIIVLFVVGSYFKQMMRTGKKVQASLQQYYAAHKAYPENLTELEDYNELATENFDEYLKYNRGSDSSDRNSSKLIIKPPLFKAVELKYSIVTSSFEFKD